MNMKKVSVYTEHPPLPIPPLSDEEIIGKRYYRVGLNLFNKNPEAGLEYLIERKYLEDSVKSVAVFLVTRPCLSKEMVGSFLCNLESPFSRHVLDHCVKEIDFNKVPVDIGLRRFLDYMRLPPNSEKLEIDRIMTAFSQRYADCNPDIMSQFRNGVNTVYVIGFAVILLNTDLHSKDLKANGHRRMKLEEFMWNLRKVDDGCDLDRDMLVGIYKRIERLPLTMPIDIVTDVRCIQKRFLVGMSVSLAQTHRRLVYFTNHVYEVPDLNKKQKADAHRRGLFLFNDLLVVAKVFKKKRYRITYAFEQSFPLAGITLQVFVNEHYKYGIRLQRSDTVLIDFNAENEHIGSKCAEELQECIAESDETARVEGIYMQGRDSEVEIRTEIQKIQAGAFELDEPTCGSHQSIDSDMFMPFTPDDVQLLPLGRSK